MSLAQASEEADIFKVSGLAVLGMTYSTEKNADFSSGIDHPNGAGSTRLYDFWGDSRLMVQLDGTLTPTFSTMLQLTAEHRYNNSFVPHVTEAALRWQIAPNAGLRIGRQPFLTFLVPDDTVAWVRPTTEIYQTGLLNLYDGAELSVKHQFGGALLTAQGYVGAVQYPIPGDLDIRLNNLRGLNLLAKFGDTTLRASHIRGRLTMHSPGLDQAFALLRTMPGGNGLADYYQVQAAPTQHTSLAYCYNSPAGYFLAEWSQFTTGESIVADSTQGHLTAGYHLGKFTPFVTLAGKQADKVTHHQNPILNALFANRKIGQKSAVIGTRWNFAPQTNFKMQYDYVINSAGSMGTLGNQQPTFLPGGHYRLISAALEHDF
ncbi:MAG: hypothetical protein PHS51_10680 [Gallionella sp.]|nr:hypothetical protein [Gallionella sp.]